MIWRHVFDADVLPMVLIAEARPPRLPIAPALLDPAAALPADPVLRKQVHAARWQHRIEALAAKAPIARQAVWAAFVDRNRARWQPDRVTVKLADKNIIDFHEGGKRPTFRIADSETAIVDYADLFTPDGRIVTRLTPERQAIIGKLRRNEPIANALQDYWYKQSGAGTRRCSALKSPSVNRINGNSARWSALGLSCSRADRRMPRPGEGHTVLQGREHTCRPALRRSRVRHCGYLGAARNRYLFEFRQTILPSKMWAVAMIATCPNAVAFDPSNRCFHRYCNAVCARKDLADVPFDLIFVVRVYRYFYALGRTHVLSESYAKP